VATSHVKHVLDCSKVDTRILHRTLHRVRLARSRLAVRQNAGIKTLHRRCNHGAHVCEYRGLRSLRVVYAVKVESPPADQKNQVKCMSEISLATRYIFERVDTAWRLRGKSRKHGMHSRLLCAYTDGVTCTTAHGLAHANPTVHVKMSAHTHLFLGTRTFARRLARR